MAMRYDSRTCTVYQNWEWVITGYTSVTSTPVTKTKSFTYTQYWYRYGGVWEMNGHSDPPSTIDGLTYQSGFSITSTAPEPSHWASDGSTYSTPGTASATYSGNEQSGGDPIYGWGASGNSTDNSSPSISYDDGTYAGTLYRDSVSGSPSAPSYNGSYVGQTDSTSTSGTAYYSGDVPLKDTGGGDPDPTPTLGVSAKNITDTSVRATIEGLQFESSYYHLFEMELFRGNEEEYLITQSWTDSSNLHYTYFDFSGLNSGSTYTLKGFVKSTSTSGRTHAGTVAFTTTGTVVTRPSDWIWTSLVNGNTIYELGGVIRADVCSSLDWNSFCNHINLFREYKNLPSYNFTTAVSKTSLTSNHYEEARLGISELTSVPSSVITGETGVFAKLMALSNALNSIQ